MDNKDIRGVLKQMLLLQEREKNELVAEISEKRKTLSRTKRNIRRIEEMMESFKR